MFCKAMSLIKILHLNAAREHIAIAFIAFEFHIFESLPAIITFSDINA